MFKITKEEQNRITEATVRAVFRSAVVAYYVDVQHDWFECVRYNSSLPQEMAAEGIYSTTMEQFVSAMVASTHHDAARSKLSCEYIRNHLNSQDTEYTLELPISLRHKCKWFRTFVTLIDQKDGLPHHVVISARNITSEYLERKKSHELISHLQNKSDSQVKTIARQNEEQQKLLQAQQRVQEISAQLEAQKSELACKHKSLETAYHELMDFNSIIQGLQAIFSCCYYVNIDERTFTEIKSNRTIQHFFPSSRDMAVSMREYIQQNVKPGYRIKLLDFVDFSTMAQRLSDKPYIAMEYETYSHGWVRSYLVPAQYNQSSVPTHFLYVDEIIEDEKIIQNHLRRIAEIDGLTGIYNRAAGEARVVAKLKERCSGAFGILDCDKFKSINDNYGHSTGDKVLIMIASSLQEAFGTENIVLRLGGDEFAFFMEDCTSKQQLSDTVTKLFRIIDDCHIPQLKDHRVSISVGGVIFDGDAPYSFDELYEMADSRLYESKRIPYSHLTI